MDGKWERHGTTRAYENEWMNVDVVDIELSDGQRIDHQVMIPKYQQAVSTICHDSEKGVLVIWRHRFVNDQWGWEFPAGGVESGEKLEVAAERETQEETGWKPNPVTKMFSYYPTAASVELKFNCFYSDGATWVGPGRDINEAADVAWVSTDQLRTFISKGEMNEGLSLTAALFAFQFGPLKDK